MSKQTQLSCNSNVLISTLQSALKFDEKTTHEGINEMFLKCDSGFGQIDHITFENGLTALNFDINPSEDLILKIPNNNHHILHFFYALEGICYHSFDSSEKFSKVDELKTVAVASSRYQQNIIIIKKGISFKGNLITIDKDDYTYNFEYKNASERQKLLELHTIFDMLRDYLFECAHDLKIAEQLRYIQSLKVSDSVSFLLQLQARYQVILSHHIEQLYNETYKERNNTKISRSEIQKIKAVTEHIVDNPGSDHCQDKLCSQFFISQSKLQYGFREIHNTTVSNFTRKVRLDKAKDLLLNSDLNVSEIVYTVGFTSRSYFSKIFKLQFGCNPSAYKSLNKSEHLRFLN